MSELRVAPDTELDDVEEGPRVRCACPGCPELLPPDPGTGRQRLFCSDVCRQREWRLRQHDRLALEVTGLAQTAPAPTLLAALVGLRPAPLAELRDNLRSQMGDRPERSRSTVTEP